MVSTWAVVERDGGEGGDEAGTAEELGDEDGGVGLRLGAVDPLDAGPQHAGVAAPLAQHAAPVAAHLDGSTNGRALGRSIDGTLPLPGQATTVSAAVRRRCAGGG